MITQRVDLGRDSYDIHIGEMASFGILIREHCKPEGTIVIVADGMAWRFHGDAFTAALTTAGLTAKVLILPPGEKNKSIEGLTGLYRFFSETGLRRDGLVVAFGGGVIGDLAGFAAATWMRGTPFIQVPTTLLAQVDASVGGKTAIDLPWGKNLAGAFHQPKMVLIDVNTLETLSPRDFRCGMAEIIKYGAILSRSFFIRLGTPPSRAELPGIIAECCRFKSEIVSRDEKESGERMLLNFGHTFGHSIEKLGHYEVYTHGEAVAMGMILAAKAGELLGLTASGCSDALRETLSAHGLPCDSPYKPSALLAPAQMDKKAGAGGLRLVLLETLGHAFVHQPYEQALTDVLERMDESWTPA